MATVYGSPTEDILNGTTNADSIFGGASFDFGPSGNDTGYGGSGGDLIDLLDGDDTAFGGDGFDWVWDSPGNDLVYGGNDADTLEGASGDNVLYGDAGNDIFNIGALSFLTARNTVFGGSGNDIVEYAEIGSDLSLLVDLSGGSTITVTVNGVARDVLVDIEGFFGSSVADTIYGSANADTIGSNGGTDRIFGGAGNDTLIGHVGSAVLQGGAGIDSIGVNHFFGEALPVSDFSDKTQSVVANLQNFTNTVTVGGVAEDVLAGILAVWGGSVADTLTGSAGNDTFRGGDGNDTLFGGPDGTADIVDFADRAGAVVAALVAGTVTASIGASEVDLLVGFEQVFGGSANDTISNASLAYGNAGDDMLGGTGGSDTLFGGAGIDTINGGAGNDWGSFAGETQSVVIDMSSGTGTATIGGNPGDILISIENLYGGNQSDTITGSVSHTIYGGDEATGAVGDLFYGGSGTDTFYGGYGGDTFYSNSGFGYGYGGADDDVLYGGSTPGNLLFGGSEDDTIYGGNSGSAGDRLEGDIGDDVIYGGAAAVQNIQGGEGDDTVYGEGGNDIVFGGFDNDVLYGGESNDTLDGGFGDDTVIGGNGVDLAGFADFSFSTLVVDFSAGDTILATIDGFVEGTLIGMEGAIGGLRDDTLIGNAGDNVIFGGEIGGRNESLFGGDGADTIHAGIGAALVRGGPGVDRLFAAGYGAFADYSDEVAPVVVALFSRLVSNQTVTLSGGDETISAFSNLIGGSGNDTFYGHDEANTFRGGPGTDVLYGADASPTAGDTLDLVEFNDMLVPVVVDLSAGTLVTATVGGSASDVLAFFDMLAGGAAADTLTGDASLNGLYGNASDDTLSGHDGADWLYGGAGNDSLLGGVGSDTLYGGSGVDLLNGGGDVDLAWFGDSTLAVVADLAAGTATIGTIGGTSLIAVEHFVSGSGNDTLYGDALDNMFYGGTGADTVFGGAGNDTLTAATVHGGAGNDTFLDGIVDYSDQSVPILVNSNGTTATLGVTSERDRLDSLVDGLRGGSGDDVLYGAVLFGGAGNDILRGRSGDDELTFRGGDGNDTLNLSASSFIASADYSYAAGPVVVATLSGVTMTASVSATDRDTLIDPNEIIGTSFADTMTGVPIGYGGDGNDQIAGFLNYGNLTSLFGGNGDDLLTGSISGRFYGGVGNDSIVLTGGDFAVDLAVTGGTTDAVFVVSAGVTLQAGALTDVEVIIAGSTAAATLRGDAADNSFVGSTAVDTMMGRGGLDRLDGGGNVDTVLYTEETLSVIVDLAAGTATVPGGSSDVLFSVENVVGGSGADTMHGNSAINTLTGGDGSDTLYGGDGNDRLEGGAGIDRLFGGGGSDSVNLSSATLSIVLDLGAGGTVSIGGVADDVLAEIEGITGGSAADTIAGDAEANSFFGGAGVDTLYGSDGDDFLSGGTGLDTYFGGNGGDGANLFFTGETLAWFVDLSPGGTITALADGSPVDVLVGIESVASGNGNDTLIGDGQVNRLTGNGGIDSLVGLGGDDSLQPGSGNDFLFGGAGNDVAVFSDLSSGVTLTLDGENTLTAFLASGEIDVIVSVASIYGGAGADLLTGDSADNLLFGGRGADRVYGGTGNDMLEAGPDNDTLFGGNGDDLIFSGILTSTAFTLGSNSFYGDIGTDTVDYQGQVGSIVGTAGDTMTVQRGAETDLLFGVESVIGLTSASPFTEGSDTITLTGGADTADGLGGDDSIFGGDGGDLLAGGTGNDRLSGDAGDDTMRGGSGVDLLYGGADNDVADFSDQGATVLVDLGGGSTLTATIGGAAADVMVGIEGAAGGSAADTLLGSTEANRLLGNGGSDLLLARQGADTAWGGGGGDVVFGDLAAPSIDAAGTIDTLYGDAGADILFGGFGNDHMYGGGEGDVIAGNSSEDSLFGGDGDDLIEGLLNNDRIYGGAGNDALIGGTEDDTIYGGDGSVPDDDVIFGDLPFDDSINGHDLLYGGAGNDVIRGGSGQDVAYGGAGDDMLDGSLSDDFLYGDDGDDVLSGGTGTDRVYGGAGNDTLYADEGTGDTLYGGAGNDVLFGGINLDTFVIGTGDGNDTIVGFDETDRIDVDALGLSPGGITYSNVAGGMRATAAGLDVVVMLDPGETLDDTDFLF